MAPSAFALKHSCVCQQTTFVVRIILFKVCFHKPNSRRKSTYLFLTIWLLFLFFEQFWEIRIWYFHAPNWVQKFQAQIGVIEERVQEMEALGFVSEWWVSTKVFCWSDPKVFFRLMTDAFVAYIFIQFSHLLKTSRWFLIWSLFARI
jgi:hypothetical protein